MTHGNGATVRYLFDESGTRIGLYVNSAAYMYDFNVQGDVVAIRNSAGTVVAKYAYDEWGKLLSVTDASGNTITSSTHIANLNSFRYRGYYYDAETGFYYLQTRYYDPVTSRFINTDEVMGINQDMASYNLLAYCGNNPVNRADSTGQAWWGLFVACVAVVAVCAVAVVAAPVLAPVAGVAVGTLAVDAGFTGLIAGTIAMYSLTIEEPVITNSISYAKKSKQSDKARSTDKPSWVNKGMVDNGLSADENARRLLNNKYGKGNWNPGPGSEFNKIKKWLTRDLGLRSIIKSDDYSNTDVFVFDGDLYIFDDSSPGYVWVNGEKICLRC